MELIMKNNRYLPLTVFAIAILSGCNSTTKNSSLSAAHTHYSQAQSNPQISNFANVELNVAGDSLQKADQALKSGESEATINHLAYVANQQIRIAQETAFLKADESTVANAGAKRNEVRLEARTSEIAAAKAEVVAAKAETAAAKTEAKAANETTIVQSEELAAAAANAERDRALIAQQDEQLRALNARKTTRGLVITLGDVLFNTGKAQMKASGKKGVQKLADFLNKYPQRKVWIEGYTDNTGSNIVNQVLSEKRANGIRASLIEMGINSERIITRGYGERFPVTNNITAENRQLNRRVEIILTDNNGDISLR
jgi:outer membrane protein OmpA-like peptidoglycan-associated protein